MGLLLPQIDYIARMCINNNITGSVLSLGRLDFFVTLEQFTTIITNIGDETTNKTLNKLISSNKYKTSYFSNHNFIQHKIISDLLFYHTLGFKTVDCLDCDPERGNPSIIFDLNQPDIKQVVNKQFDLVIDAGVMEHVFDVRTTMLNMNDLVKNEGYIIHSMPSNNTMDHGFYQFSPTLFRDYYLANKYNIINIMVLELHQDKYTSTNASFVDRWSGFKMWEYDPYIAGKNSFGQLSDNIYITLVYAKKTHNSLRDVAPQQYMFHPNAKIMSPWR